MRGNGKNKKIIKSNKIFQHWKKRSDEKVIKGKMYRDEKP